MMAIYDRLEWILSHIKHEKVLDIGCVGQAERFGSPRWLHGLLKRVAKEVVGIDIDEQGVKQLVAKGYNVIVADAQDPKLTEILREEFDVVVASELIEHLSNLGIFLDNVFKLLRSGGILILTTPNAQYRRHIFLPNSHSCDHKVAFTMQLLEQLLRAHNFKVVEKAYLWWGPPGSVMGKCFRSKVITNLIPPWLLADTLGVIASPKK